MAVLSRQDIRILKTVSRTSKISPAENEQTNECFKLLSLTKNQYGPP